MNKITLKKSVDIRVKMCYIIITPRGQGKQAT